MLRALQITRDFPPRSTGGLSTAVGDLVAALPRHGVDPAVVSFDAWRPRAGKTARSTTGRDDPGGPVLARVSSPADQAAARDLAERFAPAIVHVHHEMLWPFGAELAAACGAPVVATIHVAQHRQSQLRGLTQPTASLQAQEMLLGAADLAIVPSPAAAVAVLEHVRSIGPRLITIPLGVADTGAARDAADHPERRARDRILAVGRFSDINGTAELWQVLARLLVDRPALTAVVAGGVPENPKAERRWLERWRAIAPQAVQARVAFPGWLSRAELAPLYAEATVFVSPSWFETFGLAIAEAMLFGAPIAATRSGGADAVLGDAGAGRLCPPRDPASLTAAIAELIDDPGTAAALGERAAARARRELSIDRSASAVAAAYARTIADVR